MPNNKKNTVRRKMSMRDYVTFINFIETGEREIDLSDCEPNALDKTAIRVMYLTSEQKAELPNFVSDYGRGVTVKKLLESIPKVGLGQFVQVPSVAAPIKKDVVVDQPEMIIEGIPVEPVRPKNLPHWVKDPLGKLEPDNIDVAEIARIVEEGEQSFDEMKDALLKLGTPDHPERMLAAHPNEFEETLGDRYTYAVSLLDVIEFAAKKRAKYVEIMTEAPPSEEENFERYFTYVLSTASIPKHPDAYGMVRDAEEVTSFSDNKIVFDNNDETVLEYEDAATMEHDLLHLGYRKKIDNETQVDIFGKKTSILKIVQKLYKKYPHGLSEDKKFYYTRREAFEDGALEL